jgi:catechol-2,3-dioxygenase
MQGQSHAVQVTAIMLAVEDLDRAKKFHGEGLGCSIARCGQLASRRAASKGARSKTNRL